LYFNWRKVTPNKAQLKIKAILFYDIARIGALAVPFIVLQRKSIKLF